MVDVFYRKKHFQARKTDSFWGSAWFLDQILFCCIYDVLSGNLTTITMKDLKLYGNTRKKTDKKPTECIKRNETRQDTHYYPSGYFPRRDEQYRVIWSI